ncbi:MAG TPA: GreA/GreB family elongation factor [Haloplasmataceae bacterium]
MSIIVTKTGIEKINNEIAKLKERLAEIRKEKNTVSGDTWYDDNPLFNSLQQEETALYARIKELEAILKEAKVVESDDENRNQVQINSYVWCHCRYPNFEEEMVFQIVGFGETDILNGRISYNSPVGKALIGRSIHDAVPVDTPVGQAIYTIKGIFNSMEEADQAMNA